MIEQAKLLTMTVILTALVWASADSLVNEAVSIRVSFTVESLANRDMLVDIDPIVQARLVDVQVTGPRRVVDDLQKREPLELHLRIADRPTGPATLTLDRETIKRALTDQRHEFGRLTIVSVQPSALPIVVDHMITRELAITTQRLTLAYDEEPEVAQSSTTVRMRESVFNNLPLPDQQTRIDISAEVERLVKAKPPGQPATVAVTLDNQPFGQGARLDPARVDVTATMQADRSVEKIPTVPIKLAVSFANLGKSYYAVARDGSLMTLVTQTITVAGPTEDIARLLQGESRAYGVIQLKAADLEELGVLKSWTPELHLPLRIELAEPVQPVEFMLADIATLEAQD